MDQDIAKVMGHGLGTPLYKNIRRMDCIVRNDDNDDYRPLDSQAGAGLAATGAITNILTATMGLVRTTGEKFDATTYNSTSYNRGWATVWYEI